MHGRRSTVDSASFSFQDTRMSRQQMGVTTSVGAVCEVPLKLSLNLLQRRFPTSCPQQLPLSFILKRVHMTYNDASMSILCLRCQLRLRMNRRSPRTRPVKHCDSSVGNTVRRSNRGAKRMMCNFRDPGAKYPGDPDIARPSKGQFPFPSPS